MSQPENQELAQDNGDSYSEDAVMAALMAKGEPAAETEEEEEPEQEAPEEAEPEEVEEEEPQDEEFEFELDGKPVKLKKSQLPEVYRNQMLDADYRRKTAEVAEAKRAAQAQSEQIQQERTHYANQLDVSLSMLHKQLIGDQEALVELAKTDPGQWVAKNAEFQQRVQLYQAAAQQREHISKAQAADQERAHAEWREAERAQLLEKLPEWRNEAKASEEQKLIGEFLHRNGYSQEELSEIFDHRSLLVARKAALFDQLQAAKAKQAKPEPRKALNPGSPKPTTDTQRSAQQEALARARKTGRPEDIERLLMTKGN